MTLKTYQAFTMAEALAAVRRDLGADAIILHTRSFKRGGFLGFWRRTIVEVTARSAEQQAKPAAKLKLRPAAAANAPSAAAKKAYQQTSAAAKLSEQSVTEQDRQKTRRLAQAMLEKHQRERAAASVPVAPIVSVPTRPAPVAVIESKPVMDPSQVARRFVLSPADGTRERHVPESAPAIRHERTKVAAAGASTAAVQDELSAIRTMVTQVLQHQVTRSGKATPALPPVLFDAYLRLISQEVSDELADQVINAVRDEMDAASLQDPKAVREAIVRQLASFIAVTPQPLEARSIDGRPLTIALVGPTGVGKTTTLAKLAATYKLRASRRVGLITSDTYRIAAVDQLRTYANIIGLPLEVVLTPAQMTTALHALRQCDVILIDTAGRGQNDEGRLDELKQFIDAADPHQVHLVLSSTAGEKVLLREAEAFSRVGVDKLVLTKLDEAVSFGVMINVMRKVGTALSFVTTGQEVPDHLEPGDGRRLASLVMGEEATT